MEQEIVCKEYLERLGSDIYETLISFWKQPSRRVLKKRCSENMQQMYRKTPMPECDFKKVVLHAFYAINLNVLIGNTRKSYSILKSLYFYRGKQVSNFPEITLPSLLIIS